MLAGFWKSKIVIKNRVGHVDEFDKIVSDDNVEFFLERRVGQHHVVHQQFIMDGNGAREQ